MTEATIINGRLDILVRDLDITPDSDLPQRILKTFYDMFYRHENSPPTYYPKIRQQQNITRAIIILQAINKLS